MAYSKKAKRQRRKSVTKRDLEAVREQIYAPQPEPYEDPREVVLGARARVMCVTQTPDLLWDMISEEPGQAISIGATCKDEARKLWDIFKRYDGADALYFRRIIGRSRFPNVAKLEMLPERMETRDDDRPDDRSEEQKDRDAVKGWMRWQGLLGHMAAHERYAISSAARGTGSALHKGGKLTTAGQAFVAAMRILREVEERG